MSARPSVTPDLSGFRPASGTSWRPYLLAWLVVGVGLALTTAVAWQLHQHARELDQTRFERLVRQSNEAMFDRFERYELALEGLAHSLAVHPQLSPAEWRFRLRLLSPEQRYPGLLEVGFAEIPGRAKLPIGGKDATPVAEERAPGTDTLHLLHGWVLPPSAADGIGANFLADPLIVVAARETIESGQPAFVYRRQLSAELSGNPATGFTMLFPVLDPAATDARTNQPAVPEEYARRWRAAISRGVVFGNIVPALLLENLFGTAPREVNFDLFSSPTPAPENWLNLRGPSPLSLRPGFNPYLSTNVVLQFPNRQWAVIFYTTPLFEMESPRDRPRVALAVGGAITALLGALMLTQIRARLRQEDIAAELRAACEDLQQVQNERERIGRDLHDGAIQSLYGLQLSLGHYERLLGRDAESARGILDRCRSAVDGLIAELRTFIVQHLPGEDDPNRMGNTGAALQQIVHRFQSASQVPIELVLKDSPPTPVTLGQQVHLRQVAQEAISNSLRHGQPHHIRVELRRQNQHLHLRVQDDGAGFDLATSRPGQGLANMQARALQLGGQLHVESAPGRGTQITLDMPLAISDSSSHGQAA